jgi:uncharacterized membrane protein
MVPIIGSYLLTIPVLVVFDLGWAGFLMKGFYRTRLGYLLAPQINFVPLIFFYLFLSVGIFYLAAYPAFLKHSLSMAIISGFLLGVLAYGTYDFTNMATLPAWPLSITIVDVLWGGAVCTITAVAGYLLLGLLV